MQSMRLPVLTLMALLLAGTRAGAQPSAPKAAPPVFIDELTWTEIRDRMLAGTKTAIIGTAGQEQKGPHMVTGEHKYVLQHTTERIARTLGDALVAPIITYVPEGSWELPLRGHMAKAGSITLPEDRFIELLVHAAKSLRAGGFTTVILIGDSGGNQNGMKAAADQLNAAWKDAGGRAMFIGDYYTKSAADIRTYLGGLGFSMDDIGSHAGMVDTSELLFVNPSLVRRDRLAPSGGSPDSGVNGDPTKATAALGKSLVQIKIDNALAQIRASRATSGGF
jgi:creatinine amidohydrolase/Fe(II)-dependent formamide hydrolase-like protein